MKNSIYKNKETKDLLMKLYDEKLESLQIEYTETDIDTPYGRTRVVQTGKPEGKSIVMFHGFNAGSPITLEAVKELNNDYCLYVIETVGQATKSEGEIMEIKDDSFAIWANHVLEQLNLQHINMVKYFLFFLSMMASGILQGQSFSVTPNPVNIEVDLDTVANAYELVAESMITNHTSDTLHLKWERIVNDKPDCWETSVFGVWIQAIPHIDSLDFELSPNMSGLLNVSAFTNLTGGEPYTGEAQVVLNITNLDDLADTLLVTFDFLADGENNCITSVPGIANDPLQVYPNPMTDFFKLRNSNDVQSLIIYDLQGNQIYRSLVSSGRHYDIGFLSQGLHFVKLFDRNDIVINTVKIIKN